MDERVKKIDTPEKCDIFARNARERGRDDLAKQARERAVQLRAEAVGAESDVEKEALAAVYAYEEGLSQKNGRRTRASRTWQMIDRHGVLEAVERAVRRDDVTQGYVVLQEMGLGDYAFEAVILRHPDSFSAEAVEVARARLADGR
jgi:hypothetical protein